MGLRNFDYLEPNSIQEACKVLSGYPEEARIFAGGTSLLLLMKQGIVRPTYLVNIKKVPGMRYIKDDGSTLRIGSLTTHHDLEISPVIEQCVPMITEIEPEVANIRVRSMGTVGGNIGFAEPLTDLPPIFIALDAQARIHDGKNERIMPLEEVFVGYYETCLEPHELITEIQINKPADDLGLKYLRFSAGSDKPAVGSAAAVRLDSDKKACVDVRLVLGCVAPTPLRVPEAEELLKEKELREELVEEAAEIASKACSPLDDIRGSEEYKRAIVKVLTRKALREAFQKAAANGDQS
jgi:aerobic carbon-monoxide dehydrogenase medium subunit